MPASTAPFDRWLLPILEEILSEAAIEQIVVMACEIGFWAAAVNGGYLSEEEIASAVAAKAGIELANGMFVNPEARNAVSESLARKYCILPLTATATTLEIATCNPFDLDCERTLAFATGRSIRMRIASRERIQARIDEVYNPAHRVAEQIADIHGQAALLLDERSDASASGATDQPVIKLVDHIVAEGISHGASDIHLEPGEHGVSVRYRIDGMLREAMVLPKPVGIPLVSRIKIMAKLDISDRLRPQGGRAGIPLKGLRIDLRVSTLPAAHGEKVVIRILDPRGSARSIESLGLDPIDGPRLQKVLDTREGLVLVTGPTGSGKTTTLYAALRKLLQRGLNIITVEDPVEYRIPGIVQVQINEKAGLTFASALRSILRQDPDVVLIGEIRDRETAAMAIQASLTGHLVFATLHTNDACSSITRLTDLGVDPAKLAAALKGIIAQRLVRRLCESCKIVAPGGVPARLAEFLGHGAMIHIPVGCAECGLSGFHGRIAAMEIVLGNSDLEREIASGASHDVLVAEARKSGTRSLWQSGVAHLIAGETGADELTRVLEPENPNLNELASDDSPGFDALAELEELLAAGAPGSEKSYDSADAGIQSQFDSSEMTKVIPGVVDVYLLRRLGNEFRVLVMQRAENTRCPGAWETVHGNLNEGERPEQGAVREVREETGLEIQRLYNVTVQPFYLHMMKSIQLAIVFAAFVSDGEVKLSEEHQAFEWFSPQEADTRFAWPRERQALSDILHLLANGDAGAVEDVLRVPLI